MKSHQDRIVSRDLQSGMILDGRGRFDVCESTHITQDTRSMNMFPATNSSSIMISNTLEFPCVEANRCHLTEKERGLRLAVVRIPKKRSEVEDTYRLEFTKQRNRQTEWYVYLDTTTNEEGIAMRSVIFRHVETGKYLHSTAEGQVATQDFVSHWTTWLMEPVKPLNHGREVNSIRNKSHSFNDKLNHSLSLDNDASPTHAQQRNSSSEAMTAYYTLLPKAFAPRRLTYTTRSAIHGGGLELTTTTAGHAAVWELEFTSGELCFISNPVMHTQIRCNVFGQLSLSSVFQGWEVFRFIEVGYGYVVISSWTHCHKYLSSDPDGKVFTSENRLGYWEKWRLEKAENGVYIISVAHPGRYMTVGREGEEPLQTTTKPTDFAKWHLDAAHGNLYYLSSTGSGNKLQVSSRRKGPFLSEHRRDWEEWKMERTAEGDITLWSKAHEKYLGCNSNGQIHTTSTKGDWSLWEMDESPYGGIFLRSKAHQRTLAVLQDVLCTTQNSSTEAETFRLEPRLPATISGPRLAALGAAGAVGIALTVAMPYGVVGAMEAAGLGATELSILAGVSAEALAGGGALLGAGVLGTTAAMVKDEIDGRKLSPTTEVKDDYLIGVQRPISAWRQW